MLLFLNGNESTQLDNNIMDTISGFHNIQKKPIQSNNFSMCIDNFNYIAKRRKEKIDNKLPDILEQNDELIHWMDEMLNSKNDDDKHRCYNEISNMLYSDSLLKNNMDNGKLLRIIENIGQHYQWLQT